MPRAHTKANAINAALIAKLKPLQAPTNSTTNSALMNKILAYSAIKINAKPPLLYSTLNPDTSSDSPSAKSKGVRLVSAKLDANHIIARGKAVNK